MFEINKDYLSEEIGATGTHVNKSGCYEMVITDAKIWKSNSSNSQSESLNLNIETLEGQKAWINLFYKKKDGNNIDFNLRHITHLSFLNNVANPSPDRDGKITSFIGKVVGVILEVGTTELRDGGVGYDYKLIGFYNPSTKQTAKEMNEKIPADVYEKHMEKYKDVDEVVLTKSNKQESMDDIDGFYTVSDDDLPF